MTVIDDADNLKVKVASGSLAETTGSGTNFISNPSFEDTSVGRSAPTLEGNWSVLSSSAIPNASQWPMNDFQGDVSASLFITESNPAVGSKHIRIFIPEEVAQTDLE